MADVIKSSKWKVLGMSKEKKRKEVKQTKEGLVYFEIWGILLIVVAFIFLSELGPVGSALNRLMKLLFGDFYWLTLLFVIYYGIKMVVKHEFISFSTLRIKGIIFFSTSLLMFTHYPIYRYLKPNLNDSHSNLVALTYNLYMSYLKQNQTKQIFGGGIIGAAALMVALMLIGEWGSYIIAIILLITGLAFLFEKTVYDFIKDSVVGSRDFFDKGRKKVSEIYGKMTKASHENKIKAKPLSSDTIRLDDEGSEPTFFNLKKEHFKVEKPASFAPNLKNLKYFPNQGVLETQKEVTLEHAKRIKRFLKELGYGELEEIFMGPSVSTFVVSLKGVGKNAFFTEAHKLQELLGGDQVRIYEEYQDKQVVKIEVPNQAVYYVSLREVIEEQYCDGLIIGRDFKGEFYRLSFQHSFNILMVGHDINSKVDLLKSLILQLIYLHQPEDVSVAIFDSTKFELNEFYTVPHLYQHTLIDHLKLAKEQLLKLYTKLEYRLNAHEECDQTIVVFLNDITDFYHGEYQDYINALILYGPKVKIYTIAATTNLDDTITPKFLSLFETMIAFRMQKNEITENLFDVDTSLLLKNGDCIVSERQYRKFTRVQCITLQDTDYLFK